MSSHIHFGLFQFDPATGELSREGVPIRLQPQPARVLSLLVEQAGDVVTREDIRRRVWGDETFVDFDRGLNFCIAQIRSALGDTAESPRFVETLPKRGYRFIAPVQRGVQGEPGPTQKARLKKAGPTQLLALAMALVAGVAAAWFAYQQVSRPAAPASIPIAVVPFYNQTGSTEFDTIAQGLADATVAGLAKWSDPPRMAVVGNAAILQQARSFRDVKRIGAELKVDYVVLGQVQRDGERVRVVAHLVRASDERHLWANRFDRPAFTLAVQGEIADAITREVAAHLKPGAPGS
jgi:DNA-binding winged helix-turn-helix (wHTH) protein/TolB-like protein